MLRRKFLKLLGAAAVAPVIPRTTSAPTLAHDAGHHDLTTGFGLAPIKAEGSRVAFDPLPIKPNAYLTDPDSWYLITTDLKNQIRRITGVTRAMREGDERLG